MGSSRCSLDSRSERAEVVWLKFHEVMQPSRYERDDGGPAPRLRSSCTTRPRAAQEEPERPGPGNIAPGSAGRESSTAGLEIDKYVEVNPP